MRVDIRKYFALLVVAALTACGGGGASDDNEKNIDGSAASVTSYEEAFRFLNQASMGATIAEARRVEAMGYEAWIDEQIALPISLQAPYVQSAVNLTGDAPRGNRVGAWVRNAIDGPDQLRQRVALALSEILVVSEGGNLAFYKWQLAMADYYDVLSRHAFGNYRDLLEEVTLHPVMGMYLNMRGNLKPDTERNIRPDENFARELLQLFSIGLVELNLDGTEKKNDRGRSIPSYNQRVVQGFAHVFTGWDFSKIGGYEDNPGPLHISRRTPMELFPNRHDTGPKKLLNGRRLPGRENGRQDLKDALDNVFAHENVAPFVSYRLIQRLVTSNPSPQYVERVARVFNDNGFGEKGDLGAVVKAILLDPEARPDSFSPIDGKLKEPMLRMTQLWRTYNAVPADFTGTFSFDYMDEKLGQGPMLAPDVFNFFLPTYAPPGPIRDQQLVAPEMQITTEYQTALLATYMHRQAFFWNTVPGRLEQGPVVQPDLLIEYSTLLDLESDPRALVRRVDRQLLGGKISYKLRNQILQMLEEVPLNQKGLRSATTIYLVVSSPEYAYQY
ncbi:MAG: DUF1800 domain-containing protein [Gammaproteobacteria bacterium]